MKWHTEKRKLSTLKNWDKNPRTISEKNFDELVSSVDELGNFEPLVIDIDGTVIAGNQRLRVARKLNQVEIEVSVPERKLTAKEIKKIGLISNRHSGEWDMDILANEFEDILQELGFDDLIPEIELVASEDGFEHPDADKVETDIVSGDLIEIGEHRLMCGDSTNINDVEELMGGEMADMVFTDPPYGVSYADKNKYLNSISRGDRIQKPIENDHMSIDDTSEFLYEAFVNMKLYLAKKSSYYITAPQGGDLLMMMMMMMQKAEIPLRHMIIWVKNNHVLGRTDYNYKHEPILFGWVDTHNFYGGGPYRFSTWEVNKPLKNDLHPTMKPVELIANALMNSTLKEDRVLDVFLGSGSTMVACHQLGRKCYGMELDPKYCQVIVDRMKKLDPNLIIKCNGEEI